MTAWVLVTWALAGGIEPSEAPVLPEQTSPNLAGAERADPLNPFVALPPQELSKKQRWLETKTRAEGKSPGTAGHAQRVVPTTTLFNVWTKEALPLLPGQRPDALFHAFLRDHFTNQATVMDLGLVEVMSRVARHFLAPRIDVVSGFRSPKYNLELRKKGHEVARTSQHCEGRAMDIRVRGVPTKTLLQFVRSLRRGGVGFYPQSQFVHCDTGPVRFWHGT